MPLGTKMWGDRLARSKKKDSKTYWFGCLGVTNLPVFIPTSLPGGGRGRTRPDGGAVMTGYIDRLLSQELGPYQGLRRPPTATSVSIYSFSDRVQCFELK